MVVVVDHAVGLVPTADEAEHGGNFRSVVGKVLAAHHGGHMAERLLAEELDHGLLGDLCEVIVIVDHGMHHMGILEHSLHAQTLRRVLHDLPHGLLVLIQEVGTSDALHGDMIGDRVVAIAAGIYETGFLDYDKMFVIADIKQIRRLNGWDKDQVSGLELQVDDYDRLDQVAEDIYFDLTERQDRNGNTFYARSIKELNPMIFNWLDVLDINVVVILALMLSVAGFTMISGLLIIILERTNMIGILKALGQNNNSIRKIFLYVSFFLIGKGMLWGNIIGISLCLLQSHFHIIQLDPSIYYLDAVPIDLSLFSLFLLNIGTLAASMLMMLGPSYLITKIDPAKSIRFE